MKKIIIAIDGPAASGKSTTARQIAEKLGYTYIDTGAMYRAITLKSLRKNLFEKLETDESLVRKLVDETEVTLRGMTVLLDGEDVSKDIRDNQVSLAVSKVSSLKPVRDKLAECQKEFGKLKGVVMDGRDIGTVIFPEAELKIYMIASARERAKRRYEELKSKNSFQTVSLEELEEEIVNRDKQDSERAASPMKKADDAIELDTSNLSIEEQVEFILKRAKEYIEQN